MDLTQDSTYLVVITADHRDLPPAILGWATHIRHIAIVDRGTSYTIKQRTHTDGQLVLDEQFAVSPDAIELVQAIVLSAMRHAAESGLVIYQHDRTILSICREVLLRSGLPFGIWFASDIHLNWIEQHMLASARIRFTFEQDLLDRFRSQQVFDCELHDAGGVMPRIEYVADRDHQNPIIHRSGQDNETRNVLLISYYMPPAETVAVHRLGYWEEMLPKIAIDRNDTRMDVTALTAVHSWQTNGDYLFVPDYGDIDVRDGDTVDLADRLKQARVNFFAAYWAERIRRFFDDHPNLRFDAVVMSGNPFYYFGLAQHFRDRWGAVTVLDFRDPFANNPRFKYTPEHKRIVTELETQYISQADYALSVNRYCVEALILDEPEKGVVVANGYDERVVDTVESIPLRTDDDKVNFIYTGSFYADRDPEPFLDALDPDQHRLVHIGRSREADAHLDQYESMDRYGLMSYEDVLGYCKSMDVGVIFTSGAAFEQTTKIFDYIAAGIDILIITNGTPHTGELENLTQDLDRVYWARNNAAEIKAFLQFYRKSASRRDPGEALPFSRRKQTEKLYDLIAENASYHHDDQSSELER